MGIGPVGSPGQLASVYPVTRLAVATKAENVNHHNMKETAPVECKGKFTPPMKLVKQKYVVINIYSDNFFNINNSLSGLPI